MTSDKNFGLFFGFIFGIAALYFYYTASNAWNILTLLTSIAFLVATFLNASVLHPLNRLWFKLGLLMGKIVSPIVLGVIFFGLITPIAIFMRLAGRDELKLKRSKTASHWQTRQPSGPTAESFKNQF